MKILLSAIALFEKHGPRILYIWFFLLSVLYSALSIQRHNHFQSGAFDLGIFDQAVWQYSHFIYPYNTVKELFILGDHLTLTLPLLAPLYWIWSDVRMLLIFQAVWISLSSLAVYGIARKRSLSFFVAFSIAFSYSIFYGIQSAVLFDFHPVVIGVGLLAWLAYFLESGKRKLFIVTLVLLLLTQENMGLALAGLGMIYIVHQKYRKWGVGFILGGIAASILASNVIAVLSPIGFQYAPEIHFNAHRLIVDLVNADEKKQVWIYTLTSFSGLFIFSPGAIGAVVFDLAQYFVTGPGFARMWSPLMHHRALLGVFAALGTIDVAYILKKRNVPLLFVTLVIIFSTIFFQLYFHYPLNKLTKKIYWQEEQWMIDNNHVLQDIPANSSVAAQQSLVPHLAHRKEIYLVWPNIIEQKKSICGERLCWWLLYAGKPEFLIVDTHPGVWLTMTLTRESNFNEAVSNMERARKIKLQKKVGDTKLYKIIY